MNRADTVCKARAKLEELHYTRIDSLVDDSRRRNQLPRRHHFEIWCRSTASPRYVVLYYIENAGKERPGEIEYWTLLAEVSDSMITAAVLSRMDKLAENGTWTSEDRDASPNRAESMRDLGWMNGWSKMPREVRRCRAARDKGEKHEIREKRLLGRCITEVVCSTCGYRYKVDSSD